MSNPTKSLSYLTSSLSLSSISRTSRGYVLRRAGGLVVVTHRRAASTAGAGAGGRPSASGSGSASGSSASGREERRLLRSSGGSGSDTRGQAFSSSTPAFFDASPGKHSFHSSAYASHQQPTPAQPPPADASPHFSSSSSPKSASLSPTAEGSLLVPHHGPSTGPSLANSADASGSTSQPSQSNSNSTNSDRATLFTSNTAASLPNHPLPSFFGTTLSIARRSNLVFRNGAYGIPKAKLGDDGGRNGKGKVVASRETSEPEHALSVGIGEDAVSTAVCTSCLARS